MEEQSMWNNRPLFRSTPTKEFEEDGEEEWLLE